MEYLEYIIERLQLSSYIISYKTKIKRYVNRIIIKYRNGEEIIASIIDNNIYLKYPFSIFYEIFYKFIPNILKGIHKINNSYFSLELEEYDNEEIKLKIIRVNNYECYLEDLRMNDIIENVLVPHLGREDIINLNEVLDDRIRDFEIFKRLFMEKNSDYSYMNNLNFFP